MAALLRSDLVTESDLQTLLTRAARRVRVERALIAGLTALAIALVCAAAGVGWMRWTGRAIFGAPLSVTLPFGVMACTGVAAFVATRPAIAVVAALVDARAHTQEHLVTWLHLRGLDERQLTATQRGFRDAQRTAALRAAESVRLSTHLPMRWPAWTRAIWLALILLLSALLIPPSEPAAFQAPEHNGTAVSIVADGGDAKNAQQNLSQLPRVQVLSPAQLRKLELMATDDKMPAPMKADALKELNDAIGGLPESELTPEVRQLLEMLRKDVGIKKDVKKDGQSVGVTERTESPKDRSEQSAAAYAPFKDTERGWSEADAHFFDVHEQLKKYYEAKAPRR